MPLLHPKVAIWSRSRSPESAVHPLCQIFLPTPLSSFIATLTGSSSFGIHVPTATTTGSIHVPAISSVGSALSAISNTTHGQISTMEAVENSKRYREFRMKQLHNRKTFQKQIERRMVSSPYFKTFHQVWPVIPIQDPAFIQNFGLEAVLHHFDSGLKALHEQSSNASKVKQICNQCGCDFASAWQIRKKVIPSNFCSARLAIFKTWRSFSERNCPISLKIWWNRWRKRRKNSRNKTRMHSSKSLHWRSSLFWRVTAVKLHPLWPAVTFQIDWAPITRWFKYRIWWVHDGPGVNYNSQTK